MAGALNQLGLKAKSWMNWQIPIITEGENTNSRIVQIITENVNKYLDSGGIAVIPGFQGISKSGDITSIGRGGSDATAVAIAKIFQTDSCDIYTDVDGVFTDGGLYFSDDDASKVLDEIFFTLNLIKHIYNDINHFLTLAADDFNR